MRKLLPALLGCFAFCCSASIAVAHPNHGVPHTHGGESGIAAGLLHPVLGLDHLLAMVAVGLIAAQFASSAKWFVPAAFVGGMLLGGCGAFAGVQLGLVEASIALSLIALGATLALGKRLPLVAVLLAVAAFGSMHGYAHGQELPSLASPLLYALGFTIATIVLHVAGVGLGIVAKQTTVGARSLQVAGGAIVAFGLFLLVTILA